MSGTTGIGWTDATWNPVAGCTRVSSGCDNCYAAQLAAVKLRSTRQHADLAVITPSGRAAFNGTIRLLPERLGQPLHWRQPRRVFVNSMSDLFHDGVPDEYIDRCFRVMQIKHCHRHIFQVLTKRPGRMRDFLSTKVSVPWGGFSFPEPWGGHIHMGVSVEDQTTADERIPILFETPAAVRWISAEPLLGPISLAPYLESGKLDWVVVGGESGSMHRTMEVVWLDAIVTECVRTGVPVFVKQDSGTLPGKQGRLSAELWAHKAFPLPRAAA